MSDSVLQSSFEERLAEVEAYLAFLTDLENAGQSGPPRFYDASKPLSPQQVQILKAGIFVQLYNLVESTVSRCLDALTKASSRGPWKAADLNPDFRREWVKVIVAANKEMNAENRLKHAVILTELLVTAAPLEEFKLEKGGVGNWNDIQIESMFERVGLKLRLSPQVRAAAKKKFRDELGPLALVVKLRNDLAHGTISFAECGSNETVVGLRQICKNTAMYLRSIVRAVERFIQRHEFLLESKRPVAASR